MEAATDLDDIDVALRFEDADAEAAAELKALFADDEVLESHAFSGTELITVIAKLGPALGKLVDFFGRKGPANPMTSLEIGPHKVSIKNWKPEDVERFLASPGFKSAIKAVRAK